MNARVVNIGVKFIICFGAFLAGAIAADAWGESVPIVEVTYRARAGLATAVAGRAAPYEGDTCRHQGGDCRDDDGAALEFDQRLPILSIRLADHHVRLDYPGVRETIDLIERQRPDRLGIGVGVVKLILHNC